MHKTNLLVQLTYFESNRMKNEFLCRE